MPNIPMSTATPDRARMIELIAAYADTLLDVHGERDAERVARTALLAEYDRVTHYRADEAPEVPE